MSGQQAPPPSGTVDGVMSQVRQERRRLVLLRLSFALIVLDLVAFAAWALPAVPIGMSGGGDYDLNSSVAVALAVGLAITSAAFVFIWAPAFRQEPLPEFLRVLFGARQLIRGKAQFASRLASECKRATRSRRYTFSVLVVQHEERQSQGLSMEPQETNIVALHVRDAVRLDDVVATPSNGQVWTLILGANDDAAQRVLQRVSRSLAAVSSEVCYAGTATFGGDGETPQALLTAAMERLAPLSMLNERRIAA